MSRRESVIQSIGRRKSATARIYMSPVEEGGAGSITVNNVDFNNYFGRETIRQVVMQPLELAEKVGCYNFKVWANGGGKSGQAGALLLGISRALEKAEPELRGVLKKAGFLTRDPRCVERKKPGLHKARKATQFSKR